MPCSAQKMALLLLPFVLLYCCHLLYAAAPSVDCAFDQMNEFYAPPTATVFRRTPKKQSGLHQAFTASEDETWIPLRVQVSDMDLTLEGQFCAPGKKYQKVPNFKGGNIWCTSNDILTPAKKSDIHELLKRAIKLHTERLQVRYFDDPWNVGMFHPQSICKSFTIPKTHFTNGFLDSDLVMYVSAVPIEKSGQLTAWALACAVDDDGRPVVAAINFAPFHVSVTRFSVRATAHHIAHALGFDYRRMISRSMVEQVVRREKKSIILKSEAVKRAAQKHFNCTTLKGMELENGLEANAREDNFYMKSHWERRNIKDDLMAPIFGGEVPVSGYYTIITLATFHALGFYRANFAMAEHTGWGAGAGCDFFTEKCINNGKNPYPRMFCTDEARLEKKKCTSDRMGMGTCSLVNNMEIPLFGPFRYFSEQNKGGSSKTLTDHCPLIFPDLSCYQLKMESNTLSEHIFGINSWCLDGENLLITQNANDVEVYGLCAEVSCKDNAVKVRLSGDTAFRPCPWGNSIDVKKISGGSFKSGSVKCPKFEEVCTIGPKGESLILETPVTEWEPDPLPPKKAQITNKYYFVSSKEGSKDLWWATVRGSYSVAKRTTDSAADKPIRSLPKDATTKKDSLFTTLSVLYLLPGLILLCAQLFFTVN